MTKTPGEADRLLSDIRSELEQPRRRAATVARYPSKQVREQLQDARAVIYRTRRDVSGRRGVPPEVIQKLMGWKTASMFQRYIMIDQKDLQQGADRLDGLL